MNNEALSVELEQLRYQTPRIATIGSLAIGMAYSPLASPPFIVDVVRVATPGEGRWADDDEAWRLRHLADDEHLVFLRQRIWREFGAAVTAGEYAFTPQA